MRRLEDSTDVLNEKVVEEGVKSTRVLIQTFLQAIKACRLYEANHPILPKFLDRLRKDFDHYFNECDSFSLLVGERQLFYRGKVVYESQDVRESLAFLFFKDGIREIQFYKGLEFREIADFLNVVRKSDFVNRLEDDLVTLLWEKDFPHIAFTTADEFFEGTGFVPARAGDFIKGFEEGVKEKTEEGEIEEPDDLMEERLEQTLNPSPGQSLVQACQLNSDEMEEINREVLAEQQLEYVYVLIDNLIEILLHLGEDMEAYENMISYFERIVCSLLEQKEVGKAATILKHLNETVESMVLKDKQILAIRRILEASSGVQSIRLLEKAMNGNGEGELEFILQYLRLLTKQAIDPLCRSLGESESGKWRKVVSDLLVELGREDIQPLTRFLTDPDPSLVCHILSILGRVGDSSTVQYLGNLVSHEDPRVREGTLQMLSKLGEKGKDFIKRFLRDPATEIRGRASLVLARTARDQAAKPLLEIVLSEDFYKRDYEEKASFFRALGETGSEELIPVLKKMARKRRWFQRTQWKEMRLCATNALRMVEAAVKLDGSGMKS